MASFKDILDKVKQGPADVVGIDVRRTVVLAVRMRRVGATTSLSAAAALPRANEDSEEARKPMELPAKLRAPHAAIAIEGSEATVKLLMLPGLHDGGLESRLVTGLGIRDTSGRRIGYKVITEGHGRQESLVLAAAVAEDEISGALSFFPSGRPAPHSVEIAGLAAMTAFTNGPGMSFKAKAVASLNIGERCSYFAVFSKGIPVLCQRLELGTHSILERVQESLGVDAQTAMGVLTDGAFDVSDIAGDVAGQMLNRIAVSRDYVERREACRIRSLFISGSVEAGRDLITPMQTAFDVERWNPFEHASVPEGVLGEDIGDPARFAAAIGACQATLEAK
ncbi:MAG: hypothetical protein FJ224_00605 [Lentisphaerae bacterium]|nr:hypothetical protein [Lentisphaerota bacterium]